MSTAKQLMHSGYFESLPKTTQEIVREALINAAKDRNGPEGWKDDNELIEEVECHRRDGFIPFSNNKGGLRYRNFTDISSYFGGGHTPSHKDAAKEIERQIEYALTEATKYTIEKMGSENFKRYFNSDASKVNYDSLTDLEETLRKQGKSESSELVQSWLNELQNAENEGMNGGYASIMHELQFKYEGKDNGVHVAYVSAALNTESPYHRSHISWAPNIFCEGSEGVEIKWRNNAELKRKLDKAFKKVSKAIF